MRYVTSTYFVLIRYSQRNEPVLNTSIPVGRGTVHTGVSKIQFVRCERGFKVCLQHSNWPEQVDPDVFIGHARRRHGNIS